MVVLITARSASFTPRLMLRYSNADAIQQGGSGGIRGLVCALYGERHTLAVTEDGVMYYNLIFC